jgi:plastocyanin
LPQDISATTTSGSFSFNNLQPGTYQYHCSIHGAPGVGMHGTIIVQ